MPRLPIFENHIRSSDVSRHQIRSELDATKLQGEAPRKGLNEQRFRQPGDALEDAVSPGEDAHQQLFDDDILTDNDRRDLFADAIPGGRELFEGGNVGRRRLI